jgi:AraC-like DNA-binding protein
MTVTEAAAQAAANRVLPDGCADIIINLGEPVVGVHDGSLLHGLPSAFVVGPMRRPIVATMRGSATLIAVRFLPGGARRFLPVPMRELADLTIPLDEILRHLAPELLERVEERGGDIGGAIAVVESLLLRRLREPHGDDGLVDAAVGMIREARGGIAIRELERMLGAGSRRLERRFGESIGLPPKLFARIMRFQHSTALLRSAAARDWQELLLLSGYFDQSHMIREYQEFAGLSPGAYIRERMGVASVQWDGRPASYVAADHDDAGAA